MSVDLSSYRHKTITETPANVVFLNQRSDYSYSLVSDDPSGGLKVIGPADKVSAITAEDLQIEINVGSLKYKSSAQRVTVAKVVIKNTDDCWVAGS